MLIRLFQLTPYVAINRRPSPPNLERRGSRDRALAGARLRARAASETRRPAVTAQIEAINALSEFTRHTQGAALARVLETLQRHSLAIEPVGPNEVRLRSVHTFPAPTLERLVEEINKAVEEDSEN